MNVEVKTSLFEIPDFRSRFLRDSILDIQKKWWFSPSSEYDYLEINNMPCASF